jgi:hypothetical protein
LLSQLTECWDDVRNIDGLVWQIPAGIGAILGLILTGLGRNVLSGRPSIIDLAAMVAAVLVSFSLILALHKNRMFQVSRNIYMKALYRQLLSTRSASDGELVGIALETDDCPMEELPGLVPRATRDLTKTLSGPTAAGFQPRQLLRRFHLLSAYKIMFGVSLCILCGEVALAVWLLVRMVELGWHG